MSHADYRDFGIKMGIPIKTAWYSSEDGIFNSDNEYLRIINKARVLEIPVLDQYDKNEHSLDIERDVLYLIDQELNRYKQEKGLYDYDDMLENFIKKSISPTFDVLFIDEAQDLSPYNGGWSDRYGTKRIKRILQAMTTKLFLSGLVLMLILSSLSKKK